MDRINHALVQVAQSHGVEVDHVYSEIQAAILQAIHHAKEQNDTKTLALWDRIPQDGSIPTPEELIAYILHHIQ